MNSFLALLNKDWRLNRLPLLALALVGVLPYGWSSSRLLQILWNWCGYRDTDRLFDPFIDIARAPMVLAVAAYVLQKLAAILTRGPSATWKSITRIVLVILSRLLLLLMFPLIFYLATDALGLLKIPFIPVPQSLNLWMTLLAGAALGGMAFAPERRDCSAEFLATLPAPRWKIISSKFAIAGGMLMLAVWANYGEFLEGVRLVLSGQWPPIINPDSIARNESTEYLCMATLTVMSFGIAWFLSTFLRSATISTAISVAATFLILNLLGIEYVNFAVIGGDYRGARHVFLGVTALPIGMISLFAATLYYSRRTAP